MRIFLTLLVINTVIQTKSQSVLEQILSFPLSDEEVGLVAAREEYLSNHKFNSPWLRELDFRMRPNNLETSLTDYRLRFGILNPAEIKANRAYYKLLLSQQDFERVAVVNDVLKRRYELILEGYYLTSSLGINEENLRKLKEIKSLIVSETGDLEDIIKLEEAITKQELTIKGIFRNMNQLRLAYSGFGINKIPVFNEANLIQKNQIDSIVSSTIEDETLELVAEKNSLAREETILKINKAEAFSNLGFVQAEYDSERGDTNDEHIRFQFGIQIPIFNTDRPDNQRRELEFIEEQKSYETLLKEESSDQELRAIELFDFLEEWRLIEVKSKNLVEYRNIIEETGGSVEAYDRLRSYTFYLQNIELRIQLDVLIRYINHLHSIGKLAENPYQNFLVSSLQSFELN